MTDYSWLDRYKGLYAQLLEGKVFIGISSNTESIHRSTKMKEGMLLTWVITGKGILKTPNNEYEIKNDSIMFRHPPLDYQLTLFPQQKHRRCYLSLPMEFFSLFLGMHPELINVPPVFDIEPNKAHLDEFLLLFDKIHNSEDQDFFQILPYIERYLLHFLEPYLAQSRAGVLKKAKAVLEEDFTSSLPAIAEKIGMSYNTFRKEFTRVYGMSPSQYRVKSRCENAKQLLSMGYSCKETADRLSYPDLYSFSHQFKLTTGISPRAYRKDHIL